MAANEITTIKGDLNHISVLNVRSAKEWRWQFPSADRLADWFQTNLITRADRKLRPLFFADHQTITPLHLNLTRSSRSASS